MSYIVPVPLSLAVISSLFGMRKHPKSGQVKQHEGLDFAVGTGTPVYAVANGTVTQRWQEGGGNVIVLNHDDGMRSSYLHLSSYSVSNGARVVAGQEIGRSGNTGTSTTGPHLHFEVRSSSNAPQDPLAYLPGTFEVTASLAKKIGRPTVAGASAGFGLAVLVVGGVLFYKKKTGRYPWQRR